MEKTTSIDCLQFTCDEQDTYYLHCALCLIISLCEHLLRDFRKYFFTLFFIKFNNKHPGYINVSCQTRIILDIEKLMLHANFANHLLPLLGVFDQLHCLLDNFLLSQAEHILFRKYIIVIR